LRATYAPPGGGTIFNRQAFRYCAAAVILVNILLLGWLLLRPGTTTLFTAVDNVAQVVNLLVVLPFCFAGAGFLWRRRGRAASGLAVTALHRWSPILLGLGILSSAAGQAVFTCYEQILHQDAPFPSWADAGFLGAYPFLMCGILLLPRQALSAASRARVLLDGLMVMTAMATFSWYFVLGPTYIEADGTIFAKALGVAYPLWDLVLIYCLLLLSRHFGDIAQRRAGSLLSLGLTIVVVTDSIFDYQTLHHTYATGGLLDLGWPVGYGLVGLGAVAMRLALAGSTNRGADTAGPAREGRLWQALLPYALVPAVGVLLFHAWRVRGDEMMEAGIDVGGLLLLGLVLLRQVLALLENRQLYARLSDAYREMAVNNETLATANQRLEALATIDPLTDLPNHRAIVARLDQELERAWRYGQPCAILFLDIDHFKTLNDNYGHAAGDAALHEFGAIVRGALRSVDTLGRWGGEEFAAILPQLDGTAALAVAERVRVAIAGHTFLAGGGLRLTCSLGVAAFPHDVERRDGLIDAADRAMYAAKRLGRNQVRAVTDPAVTALMVTGTGDSREQTALIGTVEALAVLVEARDRYTGQHTHEVAALAMRLAVALGCDAAESHMIGLAGRLHDVGKVAMPDAILQKPGRLTAEEWALMRTHPSVGADVVSRVPALRALVPTIRGHHERWDGGGYPDGLSGEAISLGARIVAVADAYGAMTTARPYQPSRPPELAIAELRRCAGGQFDPAIVVALERVFAADLIPAGRASVA
jgi:two-component system cell cycle response regulator